MKLAGISYWANGNLGDEIQSVATIIASGYTPECWVNRDHGDGEGERMLLLGNAFMIHRLMPFPPNIVPVYHAIHITTMQHETLWFEHFRQHAPIGCRDLATYVKIRRAGIPGYIAYCSTLTFPRYNGPRQGTIIVDVHRDARAQLPSSLRDGSQRLSHEIIDPEILYGSVATRHDFIQHRLEQYRTAELVITGRLHCALPCIAMGTPVVLIHQTPGSARFSGYEDIIPIHAIDRVSEINWDRIPMPSADLIAKIAEEHKQRYRQRIMECLNAL
jgi:hypothetical protein